jgi:BTB/POZ domain
VSRYHVFRNYHDFILILYLSTDFSEQDYPVHVTALFDGMAMEIKPLTRGQWDTVQLPSHLLQVNAFNSHARKRKPRLTLILDFPPLAILPVIRQFASLLDNQIMADVKFIIKDKETAAHAAILASASPVMAAMFEPGKFKEGQSRTVEITDIEPEVFQQMLRYVYTGNAPLMQEDSIAEHLLIAANKYQMDKLKAECEETLVGKITLDNAIRFLVTAHLHLAPNLKEVSMQCLIKSRIKVWNLPEWYQLNKSCNDLFIEVCRRMCKDQV